jgi:hypothetical protein
LCGLGALLGWHWRCIAARSGFSDDSSFHEGVSARTARTKHCWEGGALPLPPCPPSLGGGRHSPFLRAASKPPVRSLGCHCATKHQSSALHAPQSPTQSNVCTSTRALHPGMCARQRTLACPSFTWLHLTTIPPSPRAGDQVKALQVRSSPRAADIPCPAPESGWGPRLGRVSVPCFLGSWFPLAIGYRERREGWGKAGTEGKVFILRGHEQRGWERAEEANVGFCFFSSRLVSPLRGRCSF